ncbi:hypothetical protein [Spirobacillus cienkowskii]|jgi:hypothetical protein
MINVENNRFPHSAELFKFCKEVLNYKKDSAQKVTDQDVGALLGFDPADCTHWKYGRKNIKSIHNMHQLAVALDMDSRTLVDLSLGKYALFDALMEYQGYGEFLCNNEERQILLDEANRIIDVANIKALPIFIPELSGVIENLEMKADESQNEIILSRNQDGKYLITWSKSERMGAGLRFLIAKEFSVLLLAQPKMRDMLPLEKNSIFANRLALFLLMPSYLLQIACSQCDPARDTVEQLMSHFWMSRTLINIRLKDFLIHRN